MNTGPAAVRVNATPSTIGRYDVAVANRGEFEQRGQEAESKLDVARESATD